MASAFEIRQNMIVQAKDILLEDYHQRRENEIRKSELESRAPNYVHPPSSAEILKLATELYSFVSTPA